MQKYGQFAIISIDRIVELNILHELFSLRRPNRIVTIYGLYGTLHFNIAAFYF